VRILLIGDVVGRVGVKLVGRVLGGLRIRESLDLVIANGENADGGSGITPALYRRLIAAGCDCITLGDHIYRKKDIFKVLRQEENIVKPANFPPEAPGREWAVVHARGGQPVAVFSVLGRVFMRPVDCPFQAAERVLSQMPAEVKVRLLDMHAEATSDMQLMGRFLDGRVSAVLGTHTHVPTADERILPGGTAFQCDVGMTGPHESILGREIDKVMETTITFRPTRFHVAEGDVRLNGTIVDVDADSGKALAIRRLCVLEEEAETLEQLVADAASG
jgi:metallophosphoesterase (TIGR00282 family)